MKLTKLLYLPLVLLINGCTKDLVSTDYSEINPNIFPKSEADLKAMVNAAYYPLRGAYGDGIHSTSERGVMYIADATTEILHGKYGDQYLATLHNYKASDGLFTHYYDDFYNKISQMTLTIDLINQSTLSDDLNNINRNLLRNPVVIKVEEEIKNLDLIKQFAYLITEEKKGPLLRYIIKTQKIKQVLIFASSVHRADAIALKLSQNGASPRRIRNQFPFSAHAR